MALSLQFLNRFSTYTGSFFMSVIFEKTEKMSVYRGVCYKNILKYTEYSKKKIFLQISFLNSTIKSKNNFCLKPHISKCIWFQAFDIRKFTLSHFEKL